ncbi:flagellar basal body P-ring protein FlgI [Roseinatronobacter sp. HJB301]|uniref:Flagellar P-ring protein n=2 Tax=Roseinatronobacter alkalisoli TaxID=3028235 RepID=A0ABT5T505_9RHOB|nr:flagellar basal body P-ring protein FlgI [Roseinatronobacter sp. HJB301]MDD7970195.1 flagellar basal body P-ring protein FlgI [Roseinatronobacter sp. HJB301]
MSLSATTPVAAQTRLKDIVEFGGVRGNDLVGYGLVVGLNGTGDGMRNSPFTEEIMVTILERLGVNVTGEQFRPRNVAAVIVTATLPPFARAGSRVDVSVSAIGDASSLLGGTLVMTPLNGADGNIYAVAQGSVLSGGISITGQAAAETRGVPTSGVIPFGGRIEREVDFTLSSLRSLRLSLRNADFSTAETIERAINAQFQGSIATMLDSGTVEIDVARANVASTAHLISRIENILVVPQTRARVVMDQRSGTIVIGSDVRISHVAVSQGALTLRVEETPIVVQPNPFAEGEAIVVPRTRVGIDDQEEIALVELNTATTLTEIVEGLSALGVGPRELIDLLSTIHAAGALHADLIIR